MAPGALARLITGRRAASTLLARPFAAKARAPQRAQEPDPLSEEDDDFASGGEAAPAPTEGISKPLAGILKELGKRVPESLLKTRLEDNGFAFKYIPWHLANKILNLHAPEWSGEVRNIVYSSDGKSVSVVYRVTLYMELMQRSTERLLELLLLRIKAMEIPFRRLKEWLFAELVPALVLDFISIMKICRRCFLIIVCGLDFCFMSLSA